MIDSTMQRAWDRQEIREDRKRIKREAAIARASNARDWEGIATDILANHGFDFPGKVVGASRKQKNVMGHMGRVKGFKGVITLRAPIDPTLTANERGW